MKWGCCVLTLKRHSFARGPRELGVAHFASAGTLSVVGAVAIWWVVLVVLAELVCRLRFKARAMFLLFAHLPKAILRRRWATSVLGICLFFATFFGGMYVVVPFVPEWGTGWLPLIPGFGLTALVFRDASDDVDILRTTPVDIVIEGLPWSAGFMELQYRESLRSHIERSLGVRPSPERPLSSGTRVDLWFEYEQIEYFVSIKKLESRAANQQRLILQGEVEDILADVVARKVSQYHIVLVIGVSSEHQLGRHHVTTLMDRVFPRTYAVGQVFPTVIELEIGGSTQSDISS